MSRVLERVKYANCVGEIGDHVTFCAEAAATGTKSLTAAAHSRSTFNRAAAIAQIQTRHIAASINSNQNINTSKIRVFVTSREAYCFFTEVHKIHYTGRFKKKSILKCVFFSTKKKNIYTNGYPVNAG